MARCSASMRSIFVMSGERASASRDEVAPAAAEIGDVAREVSGQMRRASSAEPSSTRSQAKMPGWLSHEPSPTGRSDGEVAPVVGRRCCRRASARRRGSGTSTACRRAPNALPTCFSEAGGAIVVGAGADERAALGEQRPAARDVGEVLLLVLGQQDAGPAGTRRSRCAARLDQPAVFRRRYSGRNDCSASMSRNGGSSARRKNARLWRERSRFEGVDEGAAGLAHGNQDGRVP